MALEFGLHATPSQLQLSSALQLIASARARSASEPAAAWYCCNRSRVLEYLLDYPQLLDGAILPSRTRVVNNTPAPKHPLVSTPGATDPLLELCSRKGWVPRPAGWEKEAEPLPLESGGAKSSFLCLVGGGARPPCLLGGRMRA